MLFRSDDTFTVSGGSISGSIKGGTGTGIDSVDYSANGVDITIGDNTAGISEIERVIGNGSGSTIKGLATAAPAYTWTINDSFGDGINDGRVVGGTENLLFIDFANIVGGNNVDTFNISGSSTITGTIRGGLGDDVVNLTLTGAESGGFTFIGEQGTNDRIIMNGGNANYVATYTPDVLNSGNDQFIYDNAGNSYSITYDFSSTEAVQNNLTANSLTINGTSGNDTIELDASSFKVNNSLVVDFSYADNANLIVDGLAGGIDNTNILANIGTASMNITFANVAVTGATNTVTVTVTANDLAFNSAASAGIDSSQRLLTDIASLSVTNSGAVYIADASNNLDIMLINTADIVDIYLATGTISNSSNLVSSAAFLANAANGNISITGQNQLSGPITLLAANGTIVLENNIDTVLADITAADLTVNILDRKSTRLNSSHTDISRMPSSA